MRNLSELASALQGTWRFLPEYAARRLRAGAVRTRWPVFGTAPESVRECHEALCCRLSGFRPAPLHKSGFVCQGARSMSRDERAQFERMIENMYGFNLLEFNPAWLRDAQELYPDLEAQTDAFIAANPDLSPLCVELLRANARFQSPLHAAFSEVLWALHPPARAPRPKGPGRRVRAPRVDGPL